MSVISQLGWKLTQPHCDLLDWKALLPSLPRIAGQLAAETAEHFGQYIGLSQRIFG